MYDELGRLRKCFQPRMWFRVEDGEPNPFVLNDEDTFMWVYRAVDKDGSEMFQVGYFMPDGTWMADSDFLLREDATARVNYLNGGKR